MPLFRRKTASAARGMKPPGTNGGRPRGMAGQLLVGAVSEPGAWLTLIVTPQGGEPYEVTIRFGFRSPERLAELATVGTKLPLRVDPADSLKVTIDLPALGITPA